MFAKKTDDNLLDAVEKQNAQGNHLPPAIFIMGPTASGKSQIALEIAEQFPVEIVSVDSAQVYRFMDIGTAKPDQATLARIPHHLINLIDPAENYSAAQFCSDALDVMRDITQRGRIPLLVGGTMLYFQALLDGLSVLPAANGQLRTVIESDAKKLGWPAMHEKLREVDAESAARIKPTDSQRIQRALEVCMLTSRPMSEILRAPRKIDLPYRTIKLVLKPSDRSRLHQRIAIRFENMLRQGLVDEVSLIRKKFAVGSEMPSMRCVGYRQAWLYLEKEINLQELSDMGVAATRQLAKRQLTWLRSIMRKYEVVEFDCLGSDLPDRVCSFLLTVDIGKKARMK
ncbi:tRNA dimethylallyltransferase [Nitrosomonas aestuarii]|uniref:tRNA dimethylallyltransferase n=2 Tax=Nitrosomonas aestuarii TaxID=52441 RepID=A0A1I3Y850_9PROT|nr:tRNA dimethylallyltransferase [Nitrosomonas aestuarii]